MSIHGPIPVQFRDVFPAGAFATKVEPVADFDASKNGARVQAKDRETGMPLWAVTVHDPDPEARENSAKVKIASPVAPELPEEIPGFPFRPVEFDSLTVTPYVNGSGRLAYSFRAASLRAPGASVKGSSRSAA